MDEELFKSEIKRWFQDKGDKTHRLNYPMLDETSVVFDIGGHKGDFAAAIHDKYGCQVKVFEPHPMYFEHCVERFRNVEAIACFDYGIGDETGEFRLVENGDASSFNVRETDELSAVTCKVKAYQSVRQELQIPEINLMKINIEGSEFPLLKYILDKELAGDIVNIQVQFHGFIRDAVPLKAEIARRLSATHERNWCYEFVWENWQRLTTPNSPTGGILNTKKHTPA